MIFHVFITCTHRRKNSLMYCKLNKQRKVKVMKTIKEFVQNHKTACAIVGSVLGIAAFAALGCVGYTLTSEDEQKLLDEVTDDAQ